jgi:ABC-type nitrate/sulfonate/bicarbonate transport system substrate-binding protein
MIMRLIACTVTTLCLLLPMPPALAASEKKEISYGWSPCICLEPVIVAKEMDLFARRGLDVRFERFPSFAPVAQALLAKKLDSGTMNSVYALSSAAGTNSYMKLLYPMNFVGNFGGDRYGPQSFVMVRKDASTKSIADLKGKRVGIGAIHDVGHIAFLEALRREGIRRDETKFQQLPFPQMEGALANGEVDAAIMIFPFVTFALEHETVRILAPNIDDVLPETVISWLAVHPDFVSANPSTVADLASSIAEAVTWIHDPRNVEKRYALLSKWTNVPLPAIRKMGLRTQYFESFPQGFRDHEKYLRPWNELMISAGATNKYLDFHRFVPELPR